MTDPFKNMENGKKIGRASIGDVDVFRFHETEELVLRQNGNRVKMSIENFNQLFRFIIEN